MRIFYLSLAVTVTLFGCTRTPGEGGIATVTGNVELEQRIVISNPADAIVAPAADEDVFITYGDRVGPDDRVQTNFDGEFAFYGLRPGVYTVYVYSEDTLPLFNNAPDIAIVREFEIASGEESVDLGALRIFKDI
jgi:hypothetical protein